MIRRLIRGLVKIVIAVVVLVAVAAAVAIALVEWNCRPSGAVHAGTAPLVDEPGYARTEANTYWTFPEWYIVYSFEDFGAFLDARPESAFPYFGQIAGFWESTCAANRVAAALPGDHYEMKQMIYVIGLSFTVELAIKAAYENTVGRLTEWLRGARPAAEDAYAREVAQEYGRFLHQTPWYEFPFMDKLAGLWRETPPVGDSPVRNVERKFALSAEYLVKAGYGKAIGWLAGSLTAPLPSEVMFVARGTVPALLAAEPDVRAVRTLPDGSLLLAAPRYRAFTELLKRLAARGVEIVEIAGNRRILMSAVAPDGAAPGIAGAEQLFVLPVAARPGFSRIGYDVDVARLSAILVAFDEAGIAVEHLYDY